MQTAGRPKWMSDSIPVHKGVEAVYATDSEHLIKFLFSSCSSDSSFFFLPPPFLSFTLPLFFFFFFFFNFSYILARIQGNTERESEWAFCRSIKQLHFTLVTNPAYFSSFWNFFVLFLFQLLLFFLRLSPHRFNLHITTRGRVKLNNYPLLFRKFLRFSELLQIRESSIDKTVALYAYNEASLFLPFWKFSILFQFLLSFLRFSPRSPYRFNLHISTWIYYLFFWCGKIEQLSSFV